MLKRLRDVFASLNSHDVRYIVIGGIATILHGVPRSTLDLDVLIESTPENARKLLDALLDANLGTAELISPEELLANEITVFSDLVRIDVQTATPGVTFAEVWPERVEMHYQGNKVNVLALPDLIASKRASGRPVDLQDAELLARMEADSRNYSEPEASREYSEE